MAYEFVKLSDVALTESATDPKLLIEEDGEIMRISAANIATPQIKADWDEEDPNSPAFIMNKPEVGGGGGQIITYTNDSGLFLDGNWVSAEEVVNAWNSGAILRIGTTDMRSVGLVVHVFYDVNSGSDIPSSASLTYYDGESLQTVYC